MGLQSFGSKGNPELCTYFAFATASKGAEVLHGIKTSTGFHTAWPCAPKAQV
ncbi:hypothetical protein VRU48_12625 [Pedobacter sp. KR3-3]|uniref:Uncharacterized protein n=1 Tax=Pedobacter albus TaxID=3113905 RepID=A0ABU7I904_9SPHI|nr:hypothetical protein [Pedobacter sp. KR3-3]MEE1945957.1 hypothetical protein [Pedobacter sp. KR3-3]